MKEDHKRSFIDELRSLEEPKKKKILVGVTIIIMFLVLYFWLIYFNSIVAGGSVAPAAAVPSEADTLGALQAATDTVGGGTAPSDWQKILDFFGGGGGSYSVSPQ